MQCFTRHRDPDRRLRDDLAIDGDVLLRDGVDCQLRDSYDLKVGRAAGSTDRRNTFRELLSWGLIEQGLSRPFIELSCDRAELGLAMQGQIGATRKILAEQSVGVFV